MFVHSARVAINMHNDNSLTQTKTTKYSALLLSLLLLGYPFTMGLSEMSVDLSNTASCTEDGIGAAMCCGGEDLRA